MWLLHAEERASTKLSTGPGSTPLKDFAGHSPQLWVSGLVALASHMSCRALVYVFTADSPQPFWLEHLSCSRRTRNCLDPARSRVPAIMALSGAGSSVAFAIAPATAVRTCAPAHAEAKPAPGKISQSSLPVACAGLMVPVLGAVRRGKKKLKTAMKDATYAFQKDAYADLEFTNDVGYLPDGTPLNKAGNAVNHPETIGADRHVAGSPLPRAKFVNSVGYLPDGTAMNAAGNAINHPEAMQPDQHIAGSPLPPSTYLADIGYLADGTPLATAGNNSVKGSPATPPAATATAAPPRMVSSAPPPASIPASQGIAMHGRKFEYSFQKDAYADLEFNNDVGYLPDGTALNRAGNAINHPETIGPDRHAPGSPLPRANFVNSVGYLPDGTPLNRAGNAINHPESIGPDMHAPGSPLPASVYAADVGYLVDGTALETAGNNSVKGTAATPPAATATAAPPGMVSSAPTTASTPVSQGIAMHGRKFEYSFQKDAYADLEFNNDVGYLPDGTALNRAGNAINHPETIGPDRHAPGSPLPRANFVNSVGYLPDGTPLNRAGNAINHPESIGPDMHAPGSPLPASVYAADVGYLVDGTALETAGNNSVKGTAATPPAATATAAPPGMVSSAPTTASTPVSQGIAMHGRKFEYSFQKDAYADLEFNNDVGYLPDGTALNRAGNAINHPETIGPDRHAPGSPLPRANFVNSVGYLPDGTPLNRAGNAINHPESIGPDMHAPGSPLPASVYAADMGYLVDGTPMDRAGNLSVST